MAEHKLTTFLTSNLDVNENDLVSLLEHCTIKKFKKNAFLLQVNEQCKHTIFVEKGLLRQYSVDPKGKEHILAFAPENWFLSDRESMFFNQASKYNIQALEDSSVAMLDEDFMNLLAQNVPGFTNFNNRLLHNHIRHLQERITLLLSASSQERYLQFVAMYPDIMLRVPQGMIAAYLGITPESLSRVRKNLAKENFGR